MKTSYSFLLFCCGLLAVSQLSVVRADCGLFEESRRASTSRKGSKKDDSKDEDDQSVDDTEIKNSTIRVAHIGNSVQYYGDLPRLLERILQETFDTVVQGSCLRPASTIRSVFDKGNGVESRFNTTEALMADGVSFDIGYPTVQDMLLNASMDNILLDQDDDDEDKLWDFVIVNDRTRHPADPETRGQSLKKLEEEYVPLLEESGNPTVVFTMTWAFREPVRGADAFGTFDEFTELLLDGYEEYRKAVDDSIVAPTGLAFQYIRNMYPAFNETGGDGLADDDDDFSWKWLYNEDHFHPSPHGQLLQAFVLYSSIVGAAPPPTYNQTWWDAIRYYQPSDRAPQPLPTVAEAEILRNAACQIVYEYLY